MFPKNLRIFLLIIFVLTFNVGYTFKGSIGPFARLDSDNIHLISSQPIKNVYVVYKVVADKKDSIVTSFIQALETELYKKGFIISDSIEKADIVLNLKIKKFYKTFWVGLPILFGEQRNIYCLQVKASYKTDKGQWTADFMGHEGYWEFEGEVNYKDTTTGDLARTIINPLHDYPKEKAFINAAGSGDIKEVNKFIEENIDINAENDLGYTSLIAAAEKGHKAVVELLLSKNANVNAKNEIGWSSLTYAADKDDKEIAELLLNHGAEVNITDSENRTPLVWAVIQGHKDIIELLLSRGADIGTALGWATERGRKEIVLMLSQAKDRKTVGKCDCRYLFAPIYKENKDVIQFLITNDLIEVKPEDYICKDVLIMAARMGNKQLIEFFLAKGVDVNAQDRHSEEAPLIEAAAKGYREIVEFLLSKGADINRFGSSALAYAAMEGQKDVVEFLLSRGVDVNSKGKVGYTYGSTPLGISVYDDKKEMVDLLLSKGADMNLKNREGKTPLMQAALRGQKEVVALLLSKGADINQKDSQGKTALELVLKFRNRYTNVDYREVIDILKKAEQER